MRQPEACAITPELTGSIIDRLEKGRRVRAGLAGYGRLHIDRPLPFLCVYRRPPASRDIETERLITTQAAHLVSSGDERYDMHLAELVSGIVATLGRRFGTFLLLELWETRPRADGHELLTRLPIPRFTLASGESGQLAPVLKILREELSALTIGTVPAEVYRLESEQLPAYGLEPTCRSWAQAADHCQWVALGVEGIYRSADGRLVFPPLLLELEVKLAPVLLRMFFEYVCANIEGGARQFTTLVTDTGCRTTAHFHALGRRAVVRTEWMIDRRLAEVADSYDFLLQVTPINPHEAWEEFKNGGYSRTPHLVYRPLAVDPEGIKRRLYDLPIERVEDATLARVFREKQQELDRQITMLRDRGTPRFMHGSLQLYGEIDAGLYQMARRLLYRLPAEEEGRGGFVPVDFAVQQARAELEYYRKRYRKFEGEIVVLDHLLPGLMVSRGRLLVAADVRIPRSRLDALLQHEIGTHLLTFFNAWAQPLRLLQSGLTGYDALQEGLAVLAEYLVGGLTRSRLRLLAGRVVACWSMVEGAPFADTFRRLVDDCGFREASAFTMTTRVYRGGGLTKDADYLRGLCEVLEYLGAGGELEPLLVGKVAGTHLPVIRELWLREILRPVPLRPRYLDREDVQARLARVREGISVLDLIEWEEDRSL